MKLTSLGRNSALKIRKEIITDLTGQGYKLPCNLIPVCEVVNKLNINVPYLKDMAWEINETYRRIKYNHKKR